MGSRPLRVLQLNCSRSKLANSEARLLALERQVDIVCLQEPYTLRGSVPGYSSTSRQITEGAESMTPVVILNDCLTITMRPAPGVHGSNTWFLKLHTIMSVLPAR